MSVWDAASLATSLVGDKFDGAIAVIEFYRDQVAEMDIPAEFHPGTGIETDDSAFNIDPHFFDLKADLIARFDKAIELVREADRINMSAVADIP